jgi:tetratricopeptide (TPR) repeat protein
MHVSESRKEDAPVAKSNRRRGTATSDLQALYNRVERLLAEQQFQHALELARSLHRALPSERTNELLVQAALGRARQLTASNYLRDAGATLASIAAFVHTPEQTEGLALALSRCGQFDLALRVAQPLPAGAVQGRILGDMADAAVRGGKVPAHGLSADFPSHQALILQAFAHLEAGQDDQMRETLQGIGLTSPFLEWKVLLRGLSAYYAHDDAKAMENWQRLTPDRVPARLAAPFRQAIDPAYRHQQAAETQLRLLNWHDQMQGSSLSPRLRQVQQALADPRQLAQAFRHAESLLPTLKVEAPQLAPRLATCFYWAIVDHGFPEDLQRYRRVFGSPPVDPDLSRLEAMALEHRGNLGGANEAWQRYEKSLRERVTQWPAGHADRMRALLWQHMASNVEQAADNMPPFLNGTSRLAQGQFPATVEVCYKRSLELDPDQPEVHFALVQHYLHDGKPAKALPAAKRMLKHCPEHAGALEVCGELSMQKFKYKDAVGYYARAVQANPLNADLRNDLGLAHSGLARQLVAAGQVAEARTEFQAARTLCEGESALPLLCTWAATELSVGETARAEELLQAAAATPGGQPAAALAMLMMTICSKLGKALKTRFEAELQHWLAEPASAASAYSLAAHFAGLRGSNPNYAGAKAHEKLVLTYLEKALPAQFSESQLVDICEDLVLLKAAPLLRKYFMLGRKRFPANPHFYLAEVECLELAPSRRRPVGKIVAALKKAKELAEALPAAERTALLEEVQDHEEVLGFGSPFAGFFGGEPMDAFWPGDDFDDDFEDDDDWEE